MASASSTVMSCKGKHILISVPFPKHDNLVEKLEHGLGAQVSWINCLFKADDQSVYQDVDIIATTAAMPESREVCPRLVYCHVLTAGVDYVARSSLFKDPSIRWTNSAGIHGATIAEWVFMTYMAFSKQYAYYLDAQGNKEWSFHFRAMKARDLVGQRVGILGYGGIGRQVAKVASAFNMEVIAFTATSKKTPDSRVDTGYRLPGTGDPDGIIPKEWYYGTGKEALHHFLAQKIDLLVVCCPVTDRTRNLLGKEEFDVLRQHSSYGGAFISNVARGEVIVQDDLITALNTDGSGVRGAALDVQTPEPLTAESPLWGARNCFISPHNSCHNDRYLERALNIMMENLKKPCGSTWINEVDFARGY